MKYNIGDVIKFKKDGFSIQDHFELIEKYRLVDFVGKVIQSELVRPRTNVPKQKAQLSLYIRKINT